MSTEDLIGAGAIAGSIGASVAGTSYLNDIHNANREVIKSDISDKYRKILAKSDSVFDARELVISRNKSLASPYRYDLVNSLEKSNPYIGTTREDATEYYTKIQNLADNDKTYKKMVDTSMLDNATSHDKVSRSIYEAKSNETRRRIGKAGLKNSIRSNAIRALALGGTVYGASKIIGSERQGDNKLGIGTIAGATALGIGGNIAATSHFDLKARKSVKKESGRFDTMIAKIDALKELNKEKILKETDLATEYKNALSSKIGKGRELAGKPTNYSLDFDMARRSRVYNEMLNNGPASKRGVALGKASNILHKKRSNNIDMIRNVFSKKSGYARAIVNALAIGGVAYGASKINSNS